ncbi:transcriptional regulator [Embleya sp. NPDC001921]
MWAPEQWHTIGVDGSIHCKSHENRILDIHPTGEIEMQHSDARALEIARHEGAPDLVVEQALNKHRVKEILTVPIASLVPGESPRSEGQDQEHISRLAEIDEPLPPILVNRNTGQVIDGIHRLMAALSKGREVIDVELFDGTDEDAFLHAVKANVGHGLPLSQADRRAAATRIIASHPHMSDRAIARIAGLGAKTVGAIRRRSAGALPQLNARIGRDGRIRPLNSVEGRQRAAEVIAAHPKASLREIARLAGISPATASDVRKRLESGEGPVGVLPVEIDAQDETETGRSTGSRVERKVRTLQPDPGSVVEKLLRDPSLRHKEEGRHLLRILRQNAIGMEEWAELTAAVPPHCGALVVHLARQYAETWLGFAQELDERVRSVSSGAVGM